MSFVENVSPPMLRSRAGGDLTLSDVLKSLKSIEINLNSINKRISAIEAKVDSLDKTFNVKLNSIVQKFDQLELNINSRLGEVETNLRVQKQEFERITSELDKRTDYIERLNNSSMLQISGIPVLKNEDLNSYLDTIASVISFTSEIPFTVSIYRIPLKNPKAIPSIMVHFCNKGVRNHFLLKYLKFKNLKLDHLGCFNATSRIFINEHLTKRNYLFKKKLMQLKREGLITQLFSRNGLIHIKKRDDSDIVTITNVTELNLFYESCGSVLDNNFSHN